MERFSVRAGGPGRAVIDLCGSDEQGSYRISKAAACQPILSAPASTSTGVIVAMTTAKFNGQVGVCIAIYSDERERLLRLCSADSDCAPFWDRSAVSSLRIGVPIQYRRSTGPPTLFPHRSDDVYAVELSLLRRMGVKRHRSLYELLHPLAYPRFADAWPWLMPGTSRPCVQSGLEVPSLAVVVGAITQFDDDSGLASLCTQCGKELHRVKVNCTRGGSSVGAIGAPQLLLLGLARARPPSNTCLLLLIGRAPPPAARPARMPSCAQPPAQPAPGNAHPATLAGVKRSTPVPAAADAAAQSSSEDDEPLASRLATGKGRSERAPAAPVGGWQPVKRSKSSAARADASRASAGGGASASSAPRVEREVALLEGLMPIGVRVLIGCGEADRIVARPELNGCAGELRGYDAARGRYTVHLLTGAAQGQQLALRPEALALPADESLLSGAPPRHAGVGKAAAKEGAAEGGVLERRGEADEGREGDLNGSDADEAAAADGSDADEVATETDDDGLEEAWPMGGSLVGYRVRVWWLGDGEDVSYDGVVKSFSRTRGHCVEYDDGERKYHTFDDDDEVWRPLVDAEGCAVGR
jgi:hypothetical protein